MTESNLDPVNYGSRRTDLFSGTKLQLVRKDYFYYSILMTNKQNLISDIKVILFFVFDANSSKQIMLKSQNHRKKLVLEIVFKEITSLNKSGRVAQSVGHLARKSEVLGPIPGLATYFRFSFR